MDKKISVIVPIYNIEEYVDECIETIITQTYFNIEIILVDDGSTDKSGQICDKYAKKDKRIKVIHKCNGGAAEARNVGIENATGEYITFIDGDDYIADKLVETLVSIIEKYNADTVITNLIKVNKFKQEIELENNKTVEIELSSKNAIEEMLYQNKFDTGLPAKIFKKQLFEGIKLPVGNLYEDIAILAPIFNKAKKIIYSNYIGYMYYFRKTGTTRSEFKEEKMILIDVCTNIKEFLHEEYPDIEDAAQYRLLNSAFHLLMQIDDHKYQEIKKKLWRIIKENRIAVLFNSKVRSKTKIAIIISYLGEKNLSNTFKRENK